ncbi:MAG: hypothetical protein M3077_05265 [Candidatus Dormibacteraeota bacterium]|nr:hypothetical protein [Candidatus Dormibacteraeota bacterium]
MTRTEDAVARLREVRGLRENPLPIASSSNERLWNAALDGWWGVTAQPILALGIVMPRRLPRLSALLSWTTLLGVGTAATGLAWDSILHARNPLLAQHEGILTASNPAHVL